MTNLTHVKGQILIFILQTFFQIFSFLQKILHIGLFWFYSWHFLELFEIFISQTFSIFLQKNFFISGFSPILLMTLFWFGNHFLSFFHFAKFFHLGLVWKVDLYLYHERFVTHYKYLTFVMCEIRHTLFTTHYYVSGLCHAAYDKGWTWQRLDICIAWSGLCHVTHSKGRINLWPLSCHT